VAGLAASPVYQPVCDHECKWEFLRRCCVSFMNGRFDEPHAGAGALFRLATQRAPD
jgi:hypothetical protein